MYIERKHISVRPILDEEWENAMGLAWKTFLKFEAPEYSQEGIDNFRDFITDQMLRRMFLIGEYKVLAAFYKDEMVGIISLRNKEHISLLFVLEPYHLCGIGRRLMEGIKTIETYIGGSRLTVNSSPYAKEFYHKIGCVDDDVEQLKDGIRYTPMTYIL